MPSIHAAARSQIDTLADARHLQSVHGARLIGDAVRRIGAALTRIPGLRSA